MGHSKRVGLGCCFLCRGARGVEESFNFGAVFVVFESSSSLDYSIWRPFGCLKKEKVEVLREWRGGRVIPDTGKSRIPVPIYYLKS